MRILRFSDLELVPWKNGGGLTREIASLRENSAIVWRLSMADVADDGPFSVFPGLTRILTVLEGNGLRLHIEDQTIEALFGDPVTFQGDLDVNSRLIKGPIRDFNVMFDAEKCCATVNKISGPTQLNLKAVSKRSHAVIGMEGDTVINRAHHLFKGDTAFTKMDTVELVLGADAPAVIVTLDMLD